MHVHCLHRQRNWNIHIACQKAPAVFQQRFRRIHAVEHMRLDNAPVTRHGRCIHQLVATVVHGFDGQVFVAKRNQHREHILGGYLFRQIQHVFAEFDVLRGSVSIIQQQIDVGFSILTACAQIAAGVVDQAVLNEIEAVLPLIRNGIDGDLLVIELTGFFILHLVRLAGEHHVPVFDGDVAHKELFIRACAFVVRLDDLSEKIVGLAVIPLRLLHRVHQIGEIALAVDRAHIVEIAVICQHAPAEDFYIVHFHGNHRGQLGKGVIVAITGRNLEGKRASLAHLQCQLGREQG